MLDAWFLCWSTGYVTAQDLTLSNCSCLRSFVPFRVVALLGSLRAQRLTDMTKAVTYLPFEDALDRFTWDTPRGAETRRPKRIKVGTPELQAFKTWSLQQPGGHGEAPIEYAGFAVECVSPKSCPPTAE
jgi:hypothetical protein